MSEWKDGLPPVGEVCEYIVGLDENGDVWERACLRFHYLDEIAFTLEAGGIYVEKRDTFKAKVRTLKSEAELKREKAVEEMFSAITYDELATFEWSAHAERICKCLHDAGYRKVSELTDEQMHEHINKLSPSSNCHYRLSMFEAMLWAKSQIMGEES